MCAATRLLDRHRAQRVSSERMALGSRCLSRHGCMVCHRVHRTGALWSVDMLVLPHSRSAVRQQVWSRKTTAATEACGCKLLLLLRVSTVISQVISAALVAAGSMCVAFAWFWLACNRAQLIYHRCRPCAPDAFLMLQKVHLQCVVCIICKLTLTPNTCEGDMLESRCWEGRPTVLVSTAGCV